MAPFEYFRFLIFNVLSISLTITNIIDVSKAKKDAKIKILSPLAPEIVADAGTDLVMPCNVSGNPTPRISWLKNGQLLSLNSSYDHPIKDREGLLFHPLLYSDTGNYTCFVSNIYDVKELNTQLFVKTPPSKLTNVTVHPTTVVATVRWHVENDGGYPIINFTLLYKASNANVSDSWHIPQPAHISPAMRQFFIYQLKPATNYSFKLWATNKLGPGEVVTIQAATCQPTDIPEVFGKMLADVENFGASKWLILVGLASVGVITISVISFCFMYHDDNHNDFAEVNVPRIIANPGFEIDLEQCYLMDHADFNDNIEKPVRLNNNTVILPSQV
ncbi:hypothetical protein JTE90_011742 [Oedothorax gibbosus]|uniref:Uncharacterized protein n=1 Tax=Oedothorax gibbosus TaxID=931172 RepID=A0AAV6U0R7_9ARAC|nr:hypothetical protein JTE90_011742 [Oedothorax gibbosus]